MRLRRGGLGRRRLDPRRRRLDRASPGPRPAPLLLLAAGRTRTFAAGAGCTSAVARLGRSDHGQARCSSGSSTEHRLGPTGWRDEADLLAALWDLVWAGLVSNDTLAPVRALLAGGGAHKAKPAGAAASRYRTPPRLPASRLGRASLAAARSGPPIAAGRWYRLPDRDPNPTRRATALAEALLERHGVLTRGAVMAEETPRAGSPRSTRCWPRWRSAAPPGGATSWRVWARPSSRCPARSTGCGPTDRAGPRPSIRAGRSGPSCSPRPTRPTRTAPPCRGPSGSSTEGEPGKRAPPPGRKAGALVVTVGGELASTSSGAAGPCCPIWTIRRTLLRRRHGARRAVRSGALGAVGRAGRRRDDPLVAAGRRADRAGFRATPRGLAYGPDRLNVG